MFKFIKVDSYDLDSMMNKLIQHLQQQTMTPEKPFKCQQENLQKNFKKGKTNYLNNWTMMLLMKKKILTLQVLTYDLNIDLIRL